MNLKVGTYIPNCADRLFTAVKHQGMSLTNNISELMLRRFVIRRKVMYRFATVHGVQRYCIVANSLETWKMQNKDSDEELRKLFCIGTAAG